MDTPSDWWRTFFSGMAVEWWLQATNAEQTGQEADFIVDPSQILAQNCGTTGDQPCYAQGFATPGLVGSMSFSNGDPYFLVPTKQIGFYGQDDWKVNNRLTVNLGLRWDRDFNWFGSSDITKSRSYQSLLAIASIPVGIAGIIFKEQAETTWRNPYVIGTMLIVIGLLMWLAEYAGRKSAGKIATPRLR